MITNKNIPTIHGRCTRNKIFSQLSIFLTLCFLASSVAAQIKPAKGYLYPIKVNGKFGYINAAGKVVVEPQYKLAREFFEGYGLVLIGDSAVGLINSSGKVVYTHARPYPGKWTGYKLLASDNAMMIEYQVSFSDTSAKAGFIDLERKQVTPAVYFTISAFHNGLSRASRNGNFHSDYDSSTGLGCGNIVPHPIFGYINTSGEFKIAPEYKAASGFYRGHAVVRKNFDSLAEVINTTGAKIRLADIKDDSFKCFYYFFTNEHTDAYNEEYPMDYMFNKAFLNGFIQYTNLHKDAKGKLTLPPENRYAYHFSEGVAVVDSVDDNLNVKRRFMTLHDTLLSPETYDYCHPFHEGVAGVQKNKKWGFIGKDGKYVIEPIFDDSYQGYIFKGGISRVYYKHKICYINKKGDFIWCGEEGDRSW